MLKCEFPGVVTPIAAIGAWAYVMLVATHPCRERFESELLRVVIERADDCPDVLPATSNAATL
jgi:hypothetical protein